MIFGVQVSRYLKKIEKDEAYLDSVSGLGNICTPLVLGRFGKAIYAP